MKHPVCLGFFLILLLSGLSFSQDKSADLSLPDSVMKELLKEIVKSTLTPPNETQLVYVANQGLGVDWLPEIRNVKYVLLDKINNSYGQDIYFWKNLQKKDGLYWIDFGFGDPNCTARGTTFSFEVVDMRIKDLQQTYGWGSVCCRGGSR